MPRIVSVIPPKDDSNITKAQGTKILLDNGEYLRCVHKITLVAEAESPWKAIIEVYPSNQEQIDAVLADLKVLKIGEAKSRLLEIQEEMQNSKMKSYFLNKNMTNQNQVFGLMAWTMYLRKVHGCCMDMKLF
ncbi:hypothetical protein BANRA_02739 [Acinetobacter baumannii]|nr:hypothetical protein BANRA_02739 [Acinetobacter baumannii]